MATSSSMRRVVVSRTCQFQCLGGSAPVASSLRPITSPRHRLHLFSTGSYISLGTGTKHDTRPRWQSTPRGMTMPFRIRSRDMNNEWKCNDDPGRLADFYNRFLGQGGDNTLTEETRWLAITHKSFDQGRRGFNDRLSYLGRRIVELQTSLALVAMPKDPMVVEGPDEFGRYAFEHPLLEGLGNLSERQKSAMLSKSRLSQLGREYGLDKVLRWKPKKADNLTGSGMEIVMAQALYAIVGAVSLERGGQMANRIAREKILMPLGAIMEERL